MRWMPLNLEKLAKVPSSMDDLIDFLKGPDSGLKINEGDNFLIVIDEFIDESMSPRDLRNTLTRTDGRTGLGVALHAYLEREIIPGEPGSEDELSEQQYKIETMFKLFDAFATKRKKLIAEETAKVVSDVIYYLTKYHPSGKIDTDEIISGIVNRHPPKKGKALLLALFDPEKTSGVKGQKILYDLVVREIEKTMPFSDWANKNLPEKFLANAYALTHDKSLLKIMNRQSRGKSVESDLGL